MEFVLTAYSKRIRLTLIGACALLAWQTQPAQARPLPQELAEKDRAVQLQPDSPWQLELMEDRCRLTRRFNSEAGPGLVLFEQLAPGQAFDLFIAGPDTARATNGAWFYFGMRSDLEMRQISPIEFDLEGYDNALMLSEVRIDDTQPASELVSASIDPSVANLAERIVLRRASVIVSFETGNMSEPFDALNACARDLLTSWSLDLLAHQSYRPAQLPNEQAYFARLHHELASSPKNKGHESLLRVRAIVSANGTVLDCVHEYALSSGGMEPDVCKDIRDIEFDPAVDSQGQPIDSFYSRSIHLSPYDPWTSGTHGGRDGG